MSELSLEILTPDKLSYSSEVHAVTVPGTVGSFQILFNHAPLLSTFEIGVIKIEVSSDKTVYFATGGGTIEILDNKIKILADSLEAVSNIDVERAKRALTRAQNRLEKKHTEKIDASRAEAALARANNRIKIYEKYFQLVDSN